MRDYVNQSTPCRVAFEGRDTFEEKHEWCMIYLWHISPRPAEMKISQKAL